MSNNENTVERIPPTNKYPLAIKKEKQKERTIKREIEKEAEWGRYPSVIIDFIFSELKGKIIWQRKSVKK